METATHRHDSNKLDKNDKHDTPKYTGKNAKSTANNTKGGAANTKPPFTIKHASKDADNRSPGDDGPAGETADNRKEADFGVKPLGKSTDAQRGRALNFPGARRPGPTRPVGRAGRRGVRR